jgi:hypothetical protein
MTAFIRTLFAFCAGMLTAIALTVTGTATATDTHPAPVLHGAIRHAVTTPCPYEDSMNCYWDAGTAGNGRGHSFYSIRIGRMTQHGVRVQDCITYWDRAYNRKYGQCYNS